MSLVTRSNYLNDRYLTLFWQGQYAKIYAENKKNIFWKEIEIPGDDH